jgi:hypothetical protein
VARVSNGTLARGARLAGALAFAGLCTACGGGMDPGLSIVTQDKYDFMLCREIIGHRAALIVKEKEWSDLAAKAEASPGGILVSVAAYRSELASVRTQLSVANRAARDKGCDAAGKPKS